MSDIIQIEPRYVDQVQPRYISQVQKCISTFISHNSEDNEEARYYEDLLQKAGFSAFQYGHGLDPGASIQKVVRARIKESYFFLFIVSDYSMQSEWVQRELGLAMQERKRNKEAKPVIIPVFAEKAVWRRSHKRPTEFPVRDFETGAPLDPFDLTDVRGIDRHENPEVDSGEVLKSMMRPQILVSRIDFDTETMFESTRTFQLYEAMFPELERDGIEDIMEWVLRSDIGKERKFRINDGTDIAYKLDSRYFILSVAGRAVGLGFFTYDYASNLIYGNYIAVQESWRAGDIASYFLDEITKILDERFPDNQGTVFEVEKFDKARIEAIIEHVRQHGDFESDDDRREIQKFLRVTWYQARACRFFIDDETREPLDCTSPCIDPTSSDWKSLEEDYWLMWRPKPDSATDYGNAGALWAKTVNCIYLEILTKSLAESYSECGAKYRNYATGVIDRTLAATKSKNIALGRFLHRSKSDLLKRWLALQIPLSI